MIIKSKDLETYKNAPWHPWYNWKNYPSYFEYTIILLRRNITNILKRDKIYDSDSYIYTYNIVYQELNLKCFQP